MRRAFLRRAAAFVILLAVLTLPACAGREPLRATFTAMDTVMTFTVYGKKASLENAESTVRALEKKLSVTDAGSEIYAINEHGGGYADSETLGLIRAALGFAERTGGALDITVYPAVRAWGFTTGEYRVPSDEELSALLEKVDWTGVMTDSGGCKLRQGMMLDLGAVAKGYASDRLRAQLAAEGVESAILNLGGNVMCVGKKPDGSDWSVAITDPEGGEYACVIKVGDAAVVTSGGYQRFFEQDGVIYRHIIDPATGRPVDNGLASVTVIAQSGLTADALSTALYVMGLEKAIEFWRASDDFEAVFITEDGRLIATEGIAPVLSVRGRFRGTEPEIVKK